MESMSSALVFYSKKNEKLRKKESRSVPKNPQRLLLLFRTLVLKAGKFLHKGVYILKFFINRCKTNV